MRQIVKIIKKKHLELAHFIDFKAACDTINREKILEVMKEFKIPG
jgi:hypothetical protein